MRAAHVSGDGSVTQFALMKKLANLIDHVLLNPSTRS